MFTQTAITFARSPSASISVTFADAAASRPASVRVSGQRGWNLQPDGNRAGFGTDPWIDSSRIACAPSFGRTPRVSMPSAFQSPTITVSSQLP